MQNVFVELKSVLVGIHATWSYAKDKMTMGNQQSTAVESKLVENVMTLIFMLRRGSIAFGI